MSTPRVQTSRRTAIVLAVCAPLAVGACDSDRPSTSPPPSPTAPPPPDGEVVAAARKAILVVVAGIERAVETHPRLTAEVTPWLELHAAHLAVLEDGTPTDVVEGALPPPRIEFARQQVLSTEGQLSGTLADAARQAASGDLARALASMSAAVAQRVGA